MATTKQKSLWKDAALLKLYLLLVPGSLIISASMGYDSSLMNGLQGVDHWMEYFDHPSGSLLGIMNAILPLGAVFGAMPAARLSDKYGRRWSMAAGDIIMIIFAAMQTASVNTPMYMVSRFFIGFGVTLASSSAPILAAELAHPDSRTTLTSMYNTLWYLGSIIAAWTIYGSYRIGSEWSWRLPTALQVLPAVANLIALWFLPESPRWLVGKDRGEEAKAILVKYHASGDQTSILVNAEYDEICATLQIEMTGSRSWSELFQTKANRHRTFIVVSCALFTQWSGNGLVSYYLAPVLRSTGITSQETIALINGVLQIWSLFVAIAGANIVGRIGRRPLFIAATFCMLTGMIAWTITGSIFAESGSEAVGAGILACVVFFTTSYNICWNPLAVAYPVEILPFNIRAKGVSLLMGSIKGSGVFNQFVNPIALEKIGWKYYIVYCVWLTVALLTVYFTFPETRNRSLEEISEVFASEHSCETKGKDVNIVATEHAKGD